MSRLVDERVVKMDFDNSKFEKNTKQSMSTIEKLKASLNFSDSSKTLNSAFSSVDTSPLTNGIAYAQKGFTSLEVMGITALSNITNKVIDLGLQMVKSLTVDNISAGWDKYADKTTSVATLIAQGFDMDEVNKQLDKLLFYTDETSYEFTSMVSNIGKFTAAGQDLESSVEAMMGIANWAALSGQNATTASSAMYQLSQAISAGSVRLQDYRSIQTANMDTQEFRQTVLDTAVSMGELQKTITGKYITNEGSSFDINQFTEYLKDGWFTADVLVKSLKKYSSAVDEIYDAVSNGDYSTASEAIEGMSDNLDEFGLKAFRSAQEAKTFTDAITSVKEAVASSLMSSFEKIFGQYTEAKVLWTDLANALYDAFVEDFNFLNEILGVWSDLGGRNDLFENTEENVGAFWQLFNAITEITNLIKSAWNDLFPISKFEEEDDVIKDLGTRLKSFTENLKEIATKLRLTDEKASKLKDTFKGIFSIVKVGKKIFEGFKIAISPIVNELKKLFDTTKSKVPSIAKSFADWADKTTIFTDVGKVVAFYISDLIKLIKSFHQRLKEFTSSGFGKEIADRITEVKNKIEKFFKTRKLIIHIHSIEQVLESVKNKVKSVAEFFKRYYDIGRNFIAGFTQGIKKGFASLKQKILDICTKVKSFFRKLLGIHSPSKETQSDGENWMAGFAKGIKEGYNKVKQSILDVYEKIKKGPIGTVARSIKSIFTSFDFNPIKNLFLGLKKFLVGLIQFMSPIVTFLGKVFAFIGEKLKAVTAVITDLLGDVEIKDLFTAAFWISLIAIIKNIADSIVPPFKELRNVFDSMSGYLDSKAFSEIADAIKTLAIAILLIVVSLLLLSTIDEKKLLTSVIALGVILGGIVLLIKTLSSGMSTSIKNIGDFASSLREVAKISAIASAVKKFAVAILLIAVALKVVSTIKIEELLTAAIVLAGMMGIMYLVGKFMDEASTKTLNQFSLSMMLLAAGLTLMAIPLAIIGRMKTGNLIRAGIAILGISLIMFGISKLFKADGVKNILLFSVALLAFSAALVVLSKGLQALSGLSWETLAMGLVVIAGAAAIFIVLALVLSKMSAPIITVAAGFLIFAAGALVFALALNLIVSAVKGFIELGPVIAESGASITQSFSTIINSILDALIQAVPKFMELLASLINSALLLLSETLPVLIETVIGLIDSTLQSLAEHLPSILDSLITILNDEKWKAFFDALNDWIGTSIDSMLEFLQEKLPVWIEKLVQISLEFIDGVGESLDKNSEKIAKSIWGLIVHILSFIVKFSIQITKDTATTIWGWLVSIWNIVAEWAAPILNDIGQFFTDIWNSISGFFVDLWNDITGWFDDLWKEMSSIGEDLINGLIEGLTAGWNALTGAVSAVGGWIGDTFCNIFGIHSPSKVFAKYGEYMDEGLAQGLKNGASSVYDEIKDVSSTANNKFSSAVSKIADTLSNGISDELTIRPVMDLTDIQNGTNQIYSMMNGVNGYSISGSANLASSVSNSINSKNSVGAQGGSSNSTNSNENYSYQNTFYISGDNSKDIADEVARALQEKIDRRHAVWAT